MGGNRLLRRNCLLLFLLTFTFVSIESCSCNMKHPQQHVCDADFVISVRIRRPTETPDGLTAYKFKLKRVMKMSEKAQVALSKKLVYTIPGQCAVELRSKTAYLLVGDVEGGKPWISSCSFARPWRSLAPKMKKGFRLLYQTGCDCPIMSCHWWDRCPSHGSFFCPWETSRDEEDCQGRHGVCLRRPDGSCGWLGGRLYRTCMRNRTVPSITKGGIPSNDIIGPFKVSNRRKSYRRKYHRRRRPKLRAHYAKSFALDKSLYDLKQA